MILFRARTLSSRPRRHRQIEGTGPEHRVRGRWFTSDIHEAIRYFHQKNEEAEIIAVEISDEDASKFNVAQTPRTACGIDVLAYSQNPITDYVLPAFCITSPMTVVIEGLTRVRDYIDVGYTNIPQIKQYHVNLKETQLPMAA